MMAGQKPIILGSINSMQELFIDTTEQLHNLCNQLAGSEWLALDTEFLREKTYYPKFCLLQIANDQIAACIDPLKIDDFSALMPLLEDPQITKVFHAGRQDLEIFHQLWDTLPTPLFDTQLAAMLTGHGDQIGYAPLVQKLLGITLDKSHSRTDWTLRPLAHEQQRYALDDVIYLGQIYAQLNTELESLGRSHWLEDDFKTLTTASTYQIDSQQQWQRIRGRQHLKGVQLAILQSLASWRETTAIERNKPKGWIIKDDVLLELARRKPKDKTQLSHTRGLEKHAIDRHGDTLLKLISDACALPSETWPQEKTQRMRLTTEQDAMVDILTCAVRLLAKQQQLSPQALATRKELEQLAIGNQDLALLSGWKKAVIGNDLQKILAGTLWPYCIDGQISLVSSGD
jgi:ribonuclease D